MTVVRGPLQTLVRARAKVSAQGNLLHLRHLERGEQILQQSNTALCVQVFLERGEQILQQSNTIRCVQVSQNGENRF